MVTINKQLCLVVPVGRDDGTTLYVHAQPVTQQTFDDYYLVMAKAWSAIAQQGLNAIAGPRVALNVLRDVARTTQRAAGVNWLEGDQGVERGVVGEITRLANVLLLGVRGWEPVMLDTAIRTGQLTDEEAADALNQLTFFTLAWRVAPRTDRQAMTEAAAYLYGARTTFLTLTECSNSLMILTAVENIGATTPTGAPRSSLTL